MATLLASQENWEESSKLLEGAVELLPSGKSSVTTAYRQATYACSFAGLSSTATAVALKAGKEAHHALQLLELGRGIIPGLLLEMRTNISGLK